MPIAIRVGSLFYKLVPLLDWWRVDPGLEPWEGRLGSFHCRLAYGRLPYYATATDSAVGAPEQALATEWAPPEFAALAATPLRHFTTTDVARASLEPHLNAWAAFMDLTMECPLEFRFVASKDDSGNPLEIHSSVGSFIVVAPIRNVPPPPRWLRAEPPLAEALRLQWLASRLGHAKLLDRAYWCWTMLSAAYGGTRGVATKLRISEGVLDRLRTLMRTEDPQHSRKIGAHGPPRVTFEDLAWVNRLMPKLIIRVAQVESGLVDLPRLSLPDL